MRRLISIVRQVLLRQQFRLFLPEQKLRQLLSARQQERLQQQLYLQVRLLRCLQYPLQELPTQKPEQPHLLQ